MRSAFYALLALLAGCNVSEMLGGGGESGESGGEGGGGGAATAQGIGCGVDPDTGATLCLGTTLCPELYVDPEAYPGCGFRVAGSAIDVECACYGWLCPLGATPACSDAEWLLAQANQGVVCAQVGAGVCTEALPQGTGASGTCDTVCRSECFNDPTCILACGC